MNITQYFERISFDGKARVDLRTLKDLHRHHIRSVPFENLDIHTSRPIILDLELLEEKVIRKRRGGFCYELNGLFCGLLRQIGFDVDMISARVFSGPTDYGPDFDHMALVVKLDQPWLADVGFGINFLEPIRLELDIDQQDPDGFFQIDRFDKHYLRLNTSDSKRKWIPSYLFTVEPRTLADFDGMCTYHQTSPESHFTRKRLCTIATERGRITLSDTRLIETINGQKRIRELKGENDFLQLLKNRFNIVL